MKVVTLKTCKQAFLAAIMIAFCLLRSHQASAQLKTGKNSIDLNGDNVRLKNGNKVITTNKNKTVIKTSNSKITHNKKPKRRNKDRNSNISLNTGSNSINISINDDSSDHDNEFTIVRCNDSRACALTNCTHGDADYYYYNCGSHEIAELPKKATGLYRGDLVGYQVDTDKGICKIVRTGCKTYRLDFSNGIPSIHGVQFTRKNNFNEYTSVVIEGAYSSDIEIDMSFKDLKIEGDLLRMEFDGEKQ